MDFQFIMLKREHHIATLTLNQPDRRNAISPSMVREIHAALEDVDNDDDLRVMVLTGAGKGFCAGADVGGLTGGNEEGMGTASGPEEMRRYHSRVVGKMVLRVQKMQKPTIAMVNGVAVGGGFDLALGCDIRIGSPHARFMNAFVRIGLFPGWGGTWLYPRVMGLGKALEYLFTGDFIEAEEAYRIGILNRLVPADELEAQTMALAMQLAKGPPIALRLMKMQAYKGLTMDFETALEMAAACETITLSSEDHKEGVSAFREKRQPLYRGR